MPLKIAKIGAGSIGFTRRLVHDILCVAELADTTFSFTDISERNLEMVATLCRRDIQANQLPARVVASADRRCALADADYVFCLIRQGGLEAFETDINIPLKYGIDQCVGDTLCAGGIMYAQRSIPVLLDFCRDIREVSRPGAWFETVAELARSVEEARANAQAADKGNLETHIARPVDLNRRNSPAKEALSVR
jgi:alpha-galactosidase